MDKRHLPHSFRRFFRHFNPTFLTTGILLTVFLPFVRVVPDEPLEPATPPDPITVTTTMDEAGTGDSCSLREAILTANGSEATGGCEAGGGTIDLPAGTYMLSVEGTGENRAGSGDLDVTTPITITGEGAGTTVIDGGGIDRLFEIHGDTEVMMQDLTLRNGQTGPGNGGEGFPDMSVGGGILNNGTLTLDRVVVTGNLADGGDCGNTSAYGGGILNNGTLTLLASTVAGNEARADNECAHRSAGGGIYNTAGATLSMEEGAVENNRTVEEGAGVANRGNATIRRTTFSGNRAPGGYSGGRGGSLHNTGEMELVDVTLRENSTGGRAGSDGGAIANEGTLVIRNATIEANLAEGAGHGEGRGGAIWNSGTLSLEQSLIRGNRAEGAYEASQGGSGGGIWSSGILTVTASTIGGNVTDPNPDLILGGKGGGITNHGTLQLLRSTVNGNTAGGGETLEESAVGGGLLNGVEARATIRNSTISGNLAEQGTCAGRGGGILNAGSLSLASSTVSGNRVEGACEGHSTGGGIESNGRAELLNSIVAGNEHGGEQAPDCRGELTSSGYNLIGDPDGCMLTGDDTGNITGVDAGLGALEDNGGPTLTHALLADSPAIDAGTPDDCPDVDQRGIDRPQDGTGDGTAACDIGAYEVEAGDE